MKNYMWMAEWKITGKLTEDNKKQETKQELRK